MALSRPIALVSVIRGECTTGTGARWKSRIALRKAARLMRVSPAYFLRRSRKITERTRDIAWRRSARFFICLETDGARDDHVVRVIARVELHLGLCCSPLRERGLELVRALMDDCPGFDGPLRSDAARWLLLPVRRACLHTAAVSNTYRPGRACEERTRRTRSCEGSLRRKFIIWTCALFEMTEIPWRGA